MPVPRIASHWAILLALLLGVLTGLTLNRLDLPLTPLTAFLASLAQFVGDLFLRALRFVAVPIVLASLALGVTSLGDPRALGRIGLKTVAVYTATTALAVAIGLGLALLIRPGAGLDADFRDQQIAARSADLAASESRAADLPSLWAQALDLLPANPFAALAQANMLQVITTALLLGLGLSLLARERAAPAVAALNALNDALVAIVRLIMRLAPIAVFCLVTPQIARTGPDLLAALAAYAATVLAGLLAVALLVYPTLLLLFARLSPRRFFAAIAPAQLVAFSTSSSNATLPVTMDCVRSRLGVSDRVTSFVCPLGATINMDGTALYQGVVAVFIAQMFAIDLSASQLLTIVLTATLASIGTPGIPGAGVVMILVILESIGVPPQGLAVVLGIDRLLDMCRTVLNVTGDAMTAAIIARSEGEPLSPTPTP